MVQFLETIDFDKKLTEEEASSRAAEILRDNQFLNEVFARGGPVGNESARVRIIQLRNAAASRTRIAAARACLGDDTRAAPNDLEICAKNSYLTQNEKDAVSGTAAKRKGTSGRRAVTSGGPPRIVPLPQFSNRAPEIPKNVLNHYINQQYHLSISMVPAIEVANIQPKIPLAASAQTSQTIRGIDEFRGELETQGALPLASTGDVFQQADGGITLTEQDRLNPNTAALNGAGLSDIADALGEASDSFRNRSRRNYYNIKSLTLENVMAPTKANMFIADMVTSQVILVEPHGFNIHEDIRAMADKLGYRQISPGRIVYRMDIFFSGYDQDTGEWIPFIPINVRNGTDKVKIITYYVNMIEMSADLEHTGTTYTITLVPTGHIAWRPEEMTLEAGATITGGSGNDAEKQQNFGGFLDSLGTTMTTAVNQRTHGQIEREFEFIAPVQLRSASFFEGKFASQHGFLKQTRQGESVIVAGRDVDVITILESALKDMEYTWNLFLKEEDPSHLKPRIHWSIRFNVIYEGGAHEGLYDFRKIRLQYIIEPFATFKKGTVEKKEDVALQVDTQAQLDRIREMIRLGMVNRIYDYIHTAENTEVINFGINLKQFYFRALNTFNSNQANTGEAQREAAATKINQQGTMNEVGKKIGPTGQKPPPSSFLRVTTDEAIRAIFGGDSRPKAACLFGREVSPLDIVNGGFHEFPRTDDANATAASDNDDHRKYIQQLDDHTRNDLIRLEDLEVRGDPLWLLSPYASNSGTVLSSQDENNEGGNNRTTSSGIVQTRSSRVIFLRMFAPLQNDLMNPNRNPAGTSCSIIGGFYEIVNVTSTFESGKFTQKLMGAKIENLNYAETFTDVGLIADPAADETSTDPEVPPTNSTVNADANTGGGFTGGLA